VFQRTAHYSVPAQNRLLSDEEIADYRENFRALRDVARGSQFGSALSDSLQLHRSALADSEEVRTELYESRWKQGGIALFRSYDDLLTNPEANLTAGRFVASKVREIVKDSKTAELLAPHEYYMGTKRVCLDTGYYESFNLPHVQLHDLKTDP
jgi:cyclohexanone monooxygenase